MTVRVFAAVLACAVVATLGSSALGQRPSSEPPQLTEVQRLQLKNAVLTYELATVKAQQAATEMQRTRAELEKVLSSVQVPGWELNERLEYVKKSEKGKESSPDAVR